MILIYAEGWEPLLFGTPCPHFVFSSNLLPHLEDKWAWFMFFSWNVRALSARTCYHNSTWTKPPNAYSGVKGCHRLNYWPQCFTSCCIWCPLPEAMQCLHKKQIVWLPFLCMVTWLALVNRTLAHVTQVRAWNVLVQSSSPCNTSATPLDGHPPPGHVAPSVWSQNELTWCRAKLAQPKKPVHRTMSKIFLVIRF